MAFFRRLGHGQAATFKVRRWDGRFHNWLFTRRVATGQGERVLCGAFPACDLAESLPGWRQRVPQQGVDGAQACLAPPGCPPGLLLGTVALGLLRSEAWPRGRPAQLRGRPRLLPGDTGVHAQFTGRWLVQRQKSSEAILRI